MDQVNDAPTDAYYGEDDSDSELDLSFLDDENSDGESDKTD
jgi:hypothetical protein